MNTQYLLLLASMTVFYALAYQATNAVKAVHNTPHSYTSLFKHDHGHSILSPEYTNSLVIFPAVMLGAGLISILIFTTLWLFRCICTACCRCCKCLQCLPDESRAKSMDDDQLADLRHKIVRSRRKVLGFFLGFVLLGILASQTTLLGNSYIDQGVDMGGVALAKAYDYTSSVADYSGQIHQEIVSIEGILNKDPCVELYRDFLGDIFSAINQTKAITFSVESNLRSLSGQLGQGQGELNRYAVRDKDIYVYSIYAIAMAILLLFIISLYIRKPSFSKVLTGMSLIAVVTLSVTLFLQTIGIIFLSDLCIDPAKNIASFLPAGDTRSLMLYYTTCQGTSPLHQQVSNATSYINNLRSSYEFIRNYTYLCPAGSNLSSIEPYIQAISKNAIELISLTDCTTIYDVWNHGVNQGLCTYLFNGLFTFWIGQYVLSGSLFLAMCFGVVLYDYYGHLWKVTDNDENSYDPNHVDRCCGAAMVVSSSDQNKKFDALVGMDIEELASCHHPAPITRSATLQSIDDYTAIEDSSFRADEITDSHMMLSMEIDHSSNSLV
jgi:hypothetical protein